MIGWKAGCRSVILVLGLVVAAAGVGGCGFLDEDLRLSERAFEASFETERARARLEGLEVGDVGGGGRGTISIGCGIGGHYGSGHGYAVIPPKPRMERETLRRWYRQYCPQGHSRMCRRLRRMLFGAEQTRGWGSNAVLAFVEGEEEDEKDES